MAEKTLKKVEEELICSLCLDTYTHPKLLQCFHVFCGDCLKKLVAKDQHEEQSITCPACSRVTTIPSSGIGGLQPLFHISQLLEIMEEHKKMVANQQISSNPKRTDKVYCHEHNDREAELFCETCEELVCYRCGIRGGKHASHDYEELNDFIGRYKVEIAESVEHMGKLVSTITGAMAKLDTCCSEISEQQAEIETDVHSTFEKFHRILDARETELIGKLHQITQSKLRVLTIQREQFQTTLAQLENSLSAMKEILKTESHGDFVVMKNNLKVVKQVKEVDNMLMKPRAEADMAFSTLADVKEMCQSYGQISTPDLADPSKCYVKGNVIKAVVGEISTAILHAVNFHCQPCAEPILSFECELVSELTGTRTQGSVERRGQSQYCISFQPNIKGYHWLHIKVQGQHIRGSPFTLSAKSGNSSVVNLGSSILTIPGVIEPRGVSINRRGEVVVTQWVSGNYCVSVFSPEGRKLQSFGTMGSDQGQFMKPRGVTVDIEGNIIIVDCDNHRIQKFSADGHFVAAVGKKGEEDLQFNHPIAIVFNAVNSKLYVTDSGNNRVQVLNSDLTFYSSFGKHGNDNGLFDYPRGIAYDSSGNVYVCDCYNHCIQVFTREGKFLKKFGKRGKDPGMLICPVGICTDHDNVVYVSEGANNRVSVFTSEGKFVTSFGSRGEGPGQFTWPCGITVDTSTGIVLVCDYKNNRVQMF